MATEKQNPPKLELKLDQKVKLRLLKDKPYIGTNNYGEFYLYSLADEQGTELSFFAPAEIHEQIVRLALKAGSEFSLHKKSVQNGKKISSELVLELVNGKAQAAKPSNGNGKTDNFKAIMQQSVQDAIEITKAVNTIPFQNEDIRAISSCLFIARTKTNGY